MCFGGSGRQARLQMMQTAQTEQKMQNQEAERQAKIRQGQGVIDKNYAQFNDGYYDKFKKSYAGYYNPQLDTQYADAKDKMIAQLAGKGMLESSVGAGLLGKAEKTYGDEKARIAGAAGDEANNLKSKVEKSKTNLYSINQSSADPQGISARATGEASALAAPSSFSPLGEIFSGLLNTYGMYQNSRNNSPGAPYRSPYSGGGSPTTGSGSSSVIS
jgi:hypothetical protein